MSVNLMPEPVATIVPVVFERPATQRPDTRPVEAGEKSSTGSSDQKRIAERALLDKDEPNARPPGTDPSLPPQTLFNASLISSSFKPSTTPDELAALSVAQPTEAEPESKREQKDDSPSEDGSAAATLSASSTPASDQQLDAQRVASYSLGSQMSVPATANPDWLSAVERIA